MYNKKFINILIFNLIMNTILIQAQNKTDKFERFAFGDITPTGWLKIQMENDMNGFIGNLDKLVPELINDPIYDKGRLQKHSVVKNLGNLKEGDAEGDEQYKWWNSETQSNWWDGYIRNAILLNDKQALIKVKAYINRVLSSQDEDGYIGIYDNDLRYKFNSENGELWAKTTMYRGLLAYYDYTKNEKIWGALISAVENVMKNYPINQSDPFNVGNSFSGGVAHGLTFTDVLDRIYQITGDKKYAYYSLFLYENFSQNFSSEKDVQLNSILNPDYKLSSHGVHTYEHLRPLIVAAYTSNNNELMNALKIYLSRINNATTFTGGPIGDEWIGERNANATNTGYEYCSIHELMDSYTVLMQKSGAANVGDQIERIFYNAAQGSRNPVHSCIAYLKTDNSYEMMGTKNGEIEPERKQTRYKYSPAHQDIAVCCNPNAGRITPYFVQASWFKQGEDTLIAALLTPSKLKTHIKNSFIEIENKTMYPYHNNFDFNITIEEPTQFCLKIRKPYWVDKINCNEDYKVENNYIIIERMFHRKDHINLSFETNIKISKAQFNEHYFSYGALVYARPIKHIENESRIYMKGFSDWLYSAENYSLFEYLDQHEATIKDNIISAKLKNINNQQIEQIQLVPFCKTILRQVSF